jgi:hypothetical protein
LLSCIVSSLVVQVLCDERLLSDGGKTCNEKIQGQLKELAQATHIAESI